MTNLQVTDVIEQTRELWNQGKKVMIQIAWNLAQLRKVHQGDLSFPQWVEQEIGIGQSQTSKLLTVADYFLREYTPEQIGPVAYESLYMATMLPGSTEENLAKAKTLSRLELKQELNDAEPHTGEFIEVCKHCYVVRANHN